MIRREDILSLNYYSYGQAFTGSYKGMRYRIILQKETKDDDGNVVTEKGLLASVWPEPFAFEKTAQEKITTRLFPFDEDGRMAAADWLNAMYEEGTWQPGFTMSQLKELTEGD